MGVYKVYSCSHNNSFKKDHFEMFPQENVKDPSNYIQNKGNIGMFSVSATD